MSKKKIINTCIDSLYAIPSPRLRGLLRYLLMKIDGGEVYSKALRRVFREYHGVDIGMYTHGGCFVPGSLDLHTTVGRYCSIASGVRTMNRNHPMELKSMHAIFFNPKMGICQEDPVKYIPLVIGSDVWIGHNAIILPTVESIGHGAVIGAGSVVNRDIPPYAVMVGNPARIVRYRFSVDVIETLLKSKWWEHDIDELKESFDQFQVPYEALWRERQGDVSKSSQSVS